MAATLGTRPRGSTRKRRLSEGSGRQDRHRTARQQERGGHASGDEQPGRRVVGDNPGVPGGDAEGADGRKSQGRQRDHAGEREAA